MGLLERIKNVVRSNLTDFLDRAEDPDKMIGLLIDDMEGNLREARAQLAQLGGEKNHLQRRFAALGEEMDKWDGKARIALKFGNEALAREALAKKIDLEMRSDDLRRQIVELRQTLDDLRLSADSLKSKIEYARQKRQELRLHRRREQALRAINNSYESLRRVGGDPAAGSPGLVEDAILRARGEADSVEELRRTLYDQSLDRLGAEDRVDRALDALRARMTQDREREAPPAGDPPDAPSPR